MSNSKLANRLTHDSCTVKYNLLIRGLLSKSFIFKGGMLFENSEITLENNSLCNTRRVATLDEHVST